MSRLKLKKHKLANGLNVFYCHSPHDVAFEISMHIFTGSADENESNNGVSHFLEHMMFRGSKSFPDSILLAKAMERYGGEINAVTGLETTNYWMKGDAEGTLEAIAIFADFFLNPVFTDLEIERKVILQELASDYNDMGACIDSDYLSMNTLFRGHAMGLPIIGTKNTIENLSIVDLVEKRSKFYFPENCVLTIHSNMPESKVLKAINEHFLDSWPSNYQGKIDRESPLVVLKSIKKNKEKNILFLQNNLDNQYNLKFIFPVAGGFSEEVIALTFLQRLLDDGICTRLPANIREKHGLVYDISCETQFFKEVGTFAIDALVSENLFDELLEKLLIELQKLIHDKPLQDEIDHIKYRYIFDLKQINQNPSRFLNREVNLFFCGNSFSVEQEMNVIESITAEKFHSIVKQAFLAEKKGFALVGPRAKKRRKIIDNFFAQLKS